MSTTVEQSIPLTFEDLSCVPLGGNVYEWRAVSAAGRAGLVMSVGHPRADGSWHLDQDTTVGLTRALLRNQMAIAWAQTVSEATVAS